MQLTDLALIIQSLGKKKTPLANTDLNGYGQFNCRKLQLQHLWTLRFLIWNISALASQSANLWGSLPATLNCP